MLPTKIFMPSFLIGACSATHQHPWRAWRSYGSQASTSLPAPASPCRACSSIVAEDASLSKLKPRQADEIFVVSISFFAFSSFPPPPRGEGRGGGLDSLF